MLLSLAFGSLPPAYAGPEEERCYYEVLGVAKDADADTIKKAYRLISLRCHPDVTGELSPKERQERTEAFKAAAEAFAVLSDPAFRARYDAFGERLAEMSSRLARPASEAFIELEINGTKIRFEGSRSECDALLRQLPMLGRLFGPRNPFR